MIAESHRRWRPTLSLRMRLLGWAMLMLAVASLASIVVIRQVLINQMDNRINGYLEQEVAEFRRLAAGRNPATGEPFGADIAAIADTYFRRDEPQPYEEVLIFVDGEYYGSSADTPYDLSQEPTLTDYWTSVESSEHGRTDGVPGGPVYWLAVPVIINGDVQGHLVVSQFTGPARADIERAVRTMALACLLVIVVASAGGYLAMGRALRPLRAVTDTARTIEETDLSSRIEVTGTDEVAKLARTFNAMVGRLERAFAAQQAFLSDVGHELRTPITIVRGHLELMGDDPQERRETVALVTDELDRMNRMVNDLLMLARAERPDFLQLAEVDVAAMMADVFAKASALGDRDWVLGPVVQVTLWADRQRLTQALMQLVQNAVQYSEPGDRITLAARAGDGQLRFVVSDTGVGLRPEDRTRVFDRFERGAEAPQRVEGHGLGLAIVAAIAAAHRGSVEADGAPGVGATFTLTVPLIDAGVGGGAST